MSIIQLSWADIALSSLLVIALAALSFQQRLGLEKQIAIAAARTIIQLGLVGLVLNALFADASLIWISLMAFAMLLIAGYEIRARQKRRLQGLWGYGAGTAALFVSSFSVALFALIIIIGNKPWYTPQYAIPLLGMMLGNTMTGIALSLNQLNNNTWQQRTIIEAKLMLGQHWREAIEDIYRDAMRTGMIPTINAMAAVGVVSLPGMMTGQILSGVEPMVAIKYQIIIMFMIAAGAGFGIMVALKLAIKRLFDERQRLCINRLQ